jgi:hypothetical protein
MNSDVGKFLLLFRIGKLQIAMLGSVHFLFLRNQNESLHVLLGFLNGEFLNDQDMDFQAVIEEGGFAPSQQPLN